MKFSAVVTRYFSFTGLSQNNPKWEGSEEVSCPPLSLAGGKLRDPHPPPVLPGGLETCIQGWLPLV